MKDFKTKNGFFTGNVGIGTTDADTPLHVDVVGQNDILKLTRDDGSNGTLTLNFGGANANFNCSDGGYKFATANATDAMTINSDGNVGIGTTSPGALLHLNGGAANNQAIFESTDGTSSILFKDPSGTAEFGNKGDNAVIMPAGVEKMRITSGGNIGIGTTNPNRKLQVHTNTNASQTIACTSIVGEIAVNHASIGHGSNKDGNLQLANNVGNNKVYLKSNGDSYFNGGNVGIGTTSPSAPLHIKTTNTTDTLLLESTGDSNLNAPDLILYRNSATPADADNLGVIKFRGVNDGTVGVNRSDIDYALIQSEIVDASNNAEKGSLSFWTRGAGSVDKRMTINSDGNVGIGTTDPSKKLTVDGGIHVLQYNKIHFSNTPDQVYINAPASNKFAIYTDNSSRMLVDDVGNVGIGTKNPSGKLHVFANETYADPYNYRVNPAVKIKNNAQLEPTVLSMQGENAEGSNRYGNIVWNSMSDQGGSYFSINANVRDANHLVVKGTGDVGIGTSDPDYLLHVSKNSSPAVISARSQGMGNTSGWGGYIFANAHDGTSGWSTIIGTYRSSTNVGFASTIRLAPRTGSNRYLYIDPSGDFRISATLSNVGADAGDYVSGQTSDERLKDIEDNFEYGLNKVMQLKPIAYKLKSDENQVRKLGFGAQTTQDIVPEAVFDTSQCIDGYDQDPEDEHGQIPRSEDTTLGMQYVQLIPVLTKAIQEQQAIIEDLKSQNESLVARIEALEG
jgi:hypothetical protein